MDQSGDYAFEVPVKDPEAMNEMMESIYPWTLENGMATVLHLKNTTNETQKAGALIRFEGGVYNPGKIELQPYQSVAINIQKLKDSKKPDVLGRVFPTSATHGQLAWFQETPYTMIGRAEGTDVAAGIARSFSCNALCCINFWIDYTLSPNPMNGLVGSSGQFAAEEEESDCSGTYWDYPNVQSTASSWTSSATSKATVNSMGSATFVGGGSATITANFSNLNWFINPSSGLCFRQNYNYTATAPVNVCIPASVRIVQDVIASVSGTQLVYNNCSNSYENEGGATWGNTHCYTFQLVDSCGHDITTDNYLAVEHRSPFSMNPNNQSVQNSTTTITNGRWVDWMTYLYTQSPGVPSGWFLKVNQVIHIVNQLTGRDDAVATYCQ